MPRSAAELESLGVRFQSHCDTEVVLRAYVRWGKQSFQRLRGMFAFAIWTESERRLILVRDRLGIKPLYIHQHGDDVYFGSELKTLFAFPEIERRFDVDRPESLSFAQLHSRNAHDGGRNRETSAGSLARMERRPDYAGRLLAIAISIRKPVPWKKRRRNSMRC